MFIWDDVKGEDLIKWGGRCDGWGWYIGMGQGLSVGRNAQHVNGCRTTNMFCVDL